MKNSSDKPGTAVREKVIDSTRKYRLKHQAAVAALFQDWEIPSEVRIIMPDLTPKPSKAPKTVAQFAFKAFPRKWRPYVALAVLVASVLISQAGGVVDWSLILQAILGAAQ